MTARTIYVTLRLMVLSELAHAGSETALCSETVAKPLGLPKDVVLAMLRDLVDEGLAVFHKVVFSHDEGYPMGSGFSVSKKYEEPLDDLSRTSTV